MFWLAEALGWPAACHSAQKWFCRHSNLSPPASLQGRPANPRVHQTKLALQGEPPITSPLWLSGWAKTDWDPGKTRQWLCGRLSLQQIEIQARQGSGCVGACHSSRPLSSLLASWGTERGLYTASGHIWCLDSEWPHMVFGQWVVTVFTQSVATDGVLTVSGHRLCLDSEWWQMVSGQWVATDGVHTVSSHRWCLDSEWPQMVFGQFTQ